MRPLNLTMLAILCSVVAGSALVATLKGGRPNSANDSEPLCGLTAAYGGLFEGASGAEIEVSDKNRFQLLERVRLCAENLLDGEDRSNVDKLLGAPKDSTSTSTSTSTEEQKAEQNIVEIETIAAVSKGDVVVQQRDIARRIVADWSNLDEFSERQKANHVFASFRRSLKLSKGKLWSDATAYHQMCRDAGVPVPGSVSADQRWSGPIDLSPEASDFFFRSNWTNSSLWTYRGENEGFCIALARRNPTNLDAAPFVGTICVDKAQKNACFFDNLIYEGVDYVRRIGWEEFKQTDFDQFVHPKDGQDICSTCHVGRNPFIVHPETAMGKKIRSMYAKNEPEPEKFDFLGLESSPDRWINFKPIPPTGGEADACMTCHDLPNVTKGNRFCSILISATKQTMPPGHWSGHMTNGPDFWPDEDGCFPESMNELKSYFASISKLKSICTGEAEKRCKRD